MQYQFYKRETEFSASLIETSDIKGSIILNQFHSKQTNFGALIKVTVTTRTSAPPTKLYGSLLTPKDFPSVSSWDYLTTSVEDGHYHYPCSSEEGTPVTLPWAPVKGLQATFHHPHPPFFFFNGPLLKSLLNLLQYCFCFMFGVFWPQGMWDRSFSTRDQTGTPCIGRQSLKRWTTREVPATSSST